MAGAARHRHRPVPEGLGVPRPRRRHHPRLDGRAVGAGDVAEAARRGGRPARRSNIRSPATSARRSSRCSRRSASTRRSRSRWSPAWRRARWRSARSARSIRWTPTPSTPRAWSSACTPLDAADRARLPRVVRLRAAVHLDAGGDAARDRRLEMAGVHVRLPVRDGLRRRGRDLLDRAERLVGQPDDDDQRGEDAERDHRRQQQHERPPQRAEPAEAVGPFNCANMWTGTAKIRTAPMPPETIVLPPARCVPAVGSICASRATTTNSIDMNDSEYSAKTTWS